MQGAATGTKHSHAGSFHEAQHAQGSGDKAPDRHGRSIAYVGGNDLVKKKRVRDDGMTYFIPLAHRDKG